LNDSNVNFLAAMLFAEISAMNAENMQRQVLGHSLAYGEDAYYDVMERYKNELKSVL
jgi:hypothetical protein